MVFRHYLWLPAAEIRCSAYLYDPDLDMRGSAVGGFNLIPVAVARHISQTMPVSGSFAGDVGAFLGLEVTVTVTAAEGERPVMAR